MTLQSDLIAARALIDTPEKWARGDKNGRLRPETFCAMTALGVPCEPDSKRFDAARDALIAQLPEGFEGNPQFPVVSYNDSDTTTHADILALFDRAIKAAS